jgi:hypothetical protein
MVKMKKVVLALCSVLVILSCDTGESEVESFSGEAEASSSKDSSGSSGSGNGETSGLITAGEWSDLNNWSFWDDLLNTQDYTVYQENWNFNTTKRLAFQVFDKTTAAPLNNILVTLYKDDALISEAKTDNLGEVNLFINLFESNKASASVELSDYKIKVNDEFVDQNLTLYTEGINTLNIQNTTTTQDKIEVSFVVDATGSMIDELEFLKSDLTDVINRVQEDNQNTSILTSTVFYRDEGDEYVTRRSNFSTNIATTVNFISEQSANGGGDFPEAVEVALAEAIDDLQWSGNAKTRIAFLLLDAPPHETDQIIESLKASLITAAKNGVKIIPVTASGIDKSTEFLMRYFAIATNGTYVFITNDSGIGNDHLEPTVGEYEVEFLNDLMVRLINKYAE